MRSEGDVRVVAPPGRKGETWGTQDISVAKVPGGSSVIRCASLRERSGWLWEWSSI